MHRWAWLASSGDARSILGVELARERPEGLVRRRDRRGGDSAGDPRKVPVDRSRISGIVMQIEKLRDQAIPVAGLGRLGPLLDRFLPVQRHEAQKARGQ